MANEKQFEDLGKKLYKHKYHYYELDSPSITDQEYDMLERDYVQMAEDLGKDPEISNMIGFDKNHRYFEELHKIK